MNYRFKLVSVALTLLILQIPAPAQQNSSPGAAIPSDAPHRYAAFSKSGDAPEAKTSKAGPGEGEGVEENAIEFNASGHEVTLYLEKPGVLAGWLDFQQDGDFSEPDDYIIPAQPVRAGYNSFSFAWPDSFVPGPALWARFRYSSETNLAAVQHPAANRDAGSRVQDCLVDLAPVAVTFFVAETRNDGILLKWQARSRDLNPAFHLFRAEISGGPYRQLTRAPLYCDAETRQYSYVDQAVQPGKSYHYKVADIGYRGRLTMHGPMSAVAASPVDYILEQNYPNPFNPETRINFQIKEGGYVRLWISNLDGQQVRQLLAADLAAGAHSISWNGKDDRGVTLPTGSYLYKLRVNGFEVSRRMEFVK